ncbi:hypothetical protein EG68_03609 [Paragonimus skrjabini miyazakii]|uniref:Uncharacterized protein n=1 Tax=Paragonimus skrjabini miyazakii TaxID=59628 RepID=A0A8S9Z197_9TREM|nr:hypothetical protein EG68_03609 [Paragonimus skrjabini miyazakii]
MKDLNIREDFYFRRDKDVTYAWSEVDISAHFTRELWNTRNHYTGAGTASLDGQFIDLTTDTGTQEVGCDYYACRGTTYIMCFYDLPWSIFKFRNSGHRKCNDSNRLIAHTECNSGSTWTIEHGLSVDDIFRNQKLLSILVTAIIIYQTHF